MTDKVTLHGRKSRLVRIVGAEADVKKYGGNMIRWINDEEVRQYLGRVDPLTWRQEQEWIWSLGDKPETDYVFALHSHAERGLHIGTVGLHNVDQHNKTVSFGILIGNKRYWSCGHGNDALRTVCQYAFGRLGMRKVYLSVMSSNERAQRAYEKCGFKVVGRKVQHLFRNGRYVDELSMEVFPQELK